jgi:hypothetical protein
MPGTAWITLRNYTFCIASIVVETSVCLLNVKDSGMNVEQVTRTGVGTP